MCLQATNKPTWVNTNCVIKKRNYIKEYASRFIQKKKSNSRNYKNFYQMSFHTINTRNILKTRAYDIEPVSFSSATQRVLNAAQNEALKHYTYLISSPFILLAIITDATNTLPYRILLSFGISFGAVGAYVERLKLQPVNPTVLAPKAYLFNSEAARVVDEAEQVARRQGWSEIEVIHLFIAMYKFRATYTFEIIRRSVKHFEELDAFMEHIILCEDIKMNRTGPRKFKEDKRIGLDISTGLDIARGSEDQEEVLTMKNEEDEEEWEGVYIDADGQDIIKSFGSDLTEKAYQALNEDEEDFTEEEKIRKVKNPVVGRDKELDRIIRILARKTKNNPCLVGEPGVGKTAIAEGLAYRIVRQQIPEFLSTSRIINIEIAKIVAGSKYRGDFESRMMSIVKMCEEEAKIILFIDEIHTIMGAGSVEGTLDAANIIKPALSRGQIKVIGATTEDEFRKYIKPDGALDRRFQSVRVPEPTTEECTKILEGLKATFAAYHGVYYVEGTMEACVSYSQRYILDKFLPDKAIDILDETGAYVKINGSSSVSKSDDIKKLEASRDELKDALKSKDTLRIKEAILQEVKNIELAKRVKAQLEREIRIKKNKEMLRESRNKKLKPKKKKTEQIENEKIDKKKEENIKESGEDEKEQSDEEEKKPDDEEETYDDEEEKTLTRADYVTVMDVERTVEEITGLKILKATKSEAEKLLDLENIIHKSVIGQTHAIHAISNALRRARSGLRDKNKPIGSFVFAGPTGVGKTELAKGVANAYFESKDAMLRIDMGDMPEDHGVSKLIGSPPGYIGHDAGGRLTEEIKKKPHTLILFDECEKAGAKIWQSLLPLFDEGKLADNKGQIVDFTNTIMILTSNLGVEHIKIKKKEKLNASYGADDTLTPAEEHACYTEAVNAYFKPEFINRLTEILVFDRLTKDDIIQIYDISMGKLKERALDLGIRITETPRVKGVIATLGFSPTYGARPLQRVISTILEDSIAEKLLKGTVAHGDNICIDFDREGRIALSKVTYREGYGPMVELLT